MTDSLQKIVDDMREWVRLICEGDHVEASDINDAADSIEAMMKEPVATILPSDPYDERCGVYLDSKDWRKLETLPAGTKLFLAPPDSIEAMMQEPVGWIREWETDISDEGNWLFVAYADELDDSENWRPVFLAPPDQTKRIEELEKCVTFFASVIKSGESWTDECEKVKNAVLFQQEGGKNDRNV